MDPVAASLALLILLLPIGAGAMDLPHYDLDSLVYLSTDIVLADISKDTHGDFTATVTEALYGPLQPGVKIDALTPFLTFFQPLSICAWGQQPNSCASLKDFKVPRVEITKATPFGALDPTNLCGLTTWCV